MNKLLYSAYPVLINVYTIWMFYLLFFAFFRDSETVHYELKTVPFDTLKFYYYHLTKEHNKIEFTKNVIGNIVLFIPYGFLGILYPRLKNPFWMMFVFFILINIIEFSQYFFQRGTADIDDIILNTSGMIIGYIIYKMFFLIKDK